MAESVESFSEIDDPDEWNALTAKSPHATVFHREEWMRVCERHVAGQTHRLLLRWKGEPVAVLPLFTRRYGPLRVASSPPPGVGIQYQGPLFLNLETMPQYRREEVFTAFAEALDRRMKAARISHALFRYSPGELDVRALIWRGFASELAYTYVIDLGSGLEAVRARFRRSLRNDLSRAKDKLELAEDGRHGPDLVESFVIARYREQGLPDPFPSGYVKDIAESLGPEFIRFLVASVDGRAVGAVALVMFRGNVAHWIGGTRKAPKGIPITDLLLWSGIQWAVDQGYSRFELMGANTQRLCRFKSKYNPHLVPYVRVHNGNWLSRSAERLYRALRMNAEV